MGKHDRPKDYSPTKNVKDLRVYPEYVEKSTNASYTRKRNTTPLKPNSYDMVSEYTADKLTIIASLSPSHTLPDQPVRSSAGCRAPGLVVVYWGAPGKVAISVDLS